jgi:hypothetical protein
LSHLEELAVQFFWSGRSPETQLTNAQRSSTRPLARMRNLFDLSGSHYSSAHQMRGRIYAMTG